MARYCVFCLVACVAKLTSAFPTTSSDDVMTSNLPTKDTPTLTLDRRTLHYLSITLQMLEYSTEQALNQTIKDIDAYDVMSLIQTVGKPLIPENIIEDVAHCRNIKVVFETIYDVLSQYKNLAKDIPSYACDTRPLNVRLDSAINLVKQLLAGSIQDTHVRSSVPRDRLYTLQTLGAMEIQINRVVSIVGSISKCL